MRRVLIGVVVMGWSCLAAGNVIINGSFENGLTKWYTPKGKVICGADAAPHRKCYLSIGEDKGVVLSQEYVFPTTGVIVVKMRVRGTVGATGQVILGKRCFRDAWVNSRSPFTLTGEWQQIIMRSSNGLSCDGIRVQVALDKKAKIDVDNVEAYSLDE